MSRAASDSSAHTSVTLSRARSRWVARETSLSPPPVSAAARFHPACGVPVSLPPFLCSWGQCSRPRHGPMVAVDQHGAGGPPPRRLRGAVAGGSARRPCRRTCTFCMHWTVWSCPFPLLSLSLLFWFFLPADACVGVWPFLFSLRVFGGLPRRCGGRLGTH